MNNDFKERFAFCDKIQFAGVICTAACLVIRLVFFRGSSINPLLMLLPLGIAVGMGLGKAVLINFSDNADEQEDIVEEYDKANREYEEEHRSSPMKIISRVGIYLEIVTAVVMCILKM
ncbi:MAG: hypothetical protein ACI4JF_06930 [Oscillospiraceae bacterium]